MHIYIHSCQIDLTCYEFVCCVQGTHSLNFHLCGLRHLLRCSKYIAWFSNSFPWPRVECIHFPRLIHFFLNILGFFLHISSQFVVVLSPKLILGLMGLLCWIVCSHFYHSCSACIVQCLPLASLEWGSWTCFTPQVKQNITKDSQATKLFSFTVSLVPLLISFLHTL